MDKRINSYAGVCQNCGTRVEEKAGYIKRDAETGRWKTYHNPDECPVAELPTAPETDSKALDAAVMKGVQLIAKEFMGIVPAIVEENLNMLSRVAEIKIGKLPAVKVDLAHRDLTTIITAVVAGVHPFLVGPAGSGKTTLAEQVAKTMKLKFYMASRVTSDFKLLGFINAAGTVVRTPFREAYENGGVFLFDEVDASDPDALTAFNAALSNGHCDFPDGLVDAHKDFHAIAAGNTYGRGADRQYVGRNQLDAATLDRFTVFTVDYDEELEVQLSGDAEWTKYVQRVRKACVKQGVRHIVSPRASITGARLLAAGMARDVVEEATIWKGLDDQSKARVQSDLMLGALSNAA